MEENNTRKIENQDDEKEKQKWRTEKKTGRINAEQER